MRITRLICFIHLRVTIRIRCSPGATPELRDKLLLQGAEATSTTPAEFEKLIRDELKQWEYVIREAKITPE